MNLRVMAFLLVVLVPFMTQAAVLGTNLIVNPSFETGNSTGWSFTMPAATSVTTNTAAHGIYSVALALTNAGTVSPVRQATRVTTNTDYFFTYWVNMPSGNTGTLTVRLKVGGTTNRSSTPSSSPTGGWVKKSILFNSGSATWITNEIYADSGFTGKAYVDDLSLRTIVLSAVPDVSGMTPAEAKPVLEAQGFVVNSNTIPRGSSTVPVGKVIRTSPGAGGLPAPESVITLTVSTGPEVVDAYDAWIANRNVIGLMADDDDGDGMNNWMEFAFGGDPTNALHIASPSRLNWVGNGWMYTHMQRKADTNVHYTVDVCTNLLNGPWSALVSDPVTNGFNSELDAVTYALSTNDPRAYVRVRSHNTYPPKPRKLYTYSFGGLDQMTVPDAVALLTDLGYGGVAVSGRGAADLARLSEYQALSDSLGADFEIPAVFMAHRFDQLGFSDAGQRAAIDAMAGTGGTLWIWVGDPVSVTNVAVEVVENFVAGIVAYAVSNNVKVILYPHYNTYYPTTDAAMVLVNKINHPSFGVAINLCHELMSEKGDVLAQTFANAKDRLAAVILSGALEELDRTSPSTLNYSTILSLDESEIDLRPFVQLIVDSGFEGPIGFINFQLPYAPVDYLTRTMARWNELCEEVGLYEVR